MDSVLRVEVRPQIGDSTVDMIIVRLSLSPIVTPSGVVPMLAGKHTFTYTCWGNPGVAYEVEGRTKTLTDDLLAAVRYLDAALSDLGFVVDRFAQDPKVKAAYKVVTFAGRVAEGALQSAKTTVSAGSCEVTINVGWEERTNVVVVRLYFETESMRSLTWSTHAFFVEGYAEASWLDAYTTISAYGKISMLDSYNTWHCLYQQHPHGAYCDPQKYR